MPVIDLDAAYSSDAVYLYSTKDDVKESKVKEDSSMVRPNKKARASSPSDRAPGTSISDDMMEEDIEHFDFPDMEEAVEGNMDVPDEIATLTLSEALRPVLRYRTDQV